MLRGKKTTLFLVALADMADVDFHTARKILERREMDALSVICKAAGFDRSLFLTFALLILEPSDEVMLKAKAYGELYAALPRESALRTIRFWRLRRADQSQAVPIAASIFLDIFNVVLLFLSLFGGGGRR